ncbi:hypothetical protein ACFLRF_02780 [Candidatus Altiarchaeota archaeon]
MPSYWVNKRTPKGREPMELPGAQVDLDHSILNIPLKPLGAKLDTNLSIELGKGDQPKTVGKGMTIDQVKRAPENSVWIIPDDDTKFFRVPVKQLEDSGHIEPILQEEVDVMRTKIEWDMPGAPQGPLLTQAPVLSSIFVGLRQDTSGVGEGPTITTKNELFATMAHMDEKERLLVRERLKANVTALGGKVEEGPEGKPKFFASDMQFNFAMRLLDAAGDHNDRRQSEEFLDAVRAKVDDRLRQEDYLPDESPAHYNKLQQLLSSKNHNEIYRGIGVLDMTSSEILYTLSRETFEESPGHGKGGDVKVPTMAIQLGAACTRMATKIKLKIQ